MRNVKFTAQTNGTPVSSCEMVLVISVDGTVREVLQAPEDHTTDLEGSSLESFWSSEILEQVQHSIKRTLRSRQMQSVEFSNDCNDGHFEVIFIPHGRDRVLAVVRDRSAQRTAIEKMQQLAYIDEATKLPNREFLLEELRRCTDHLRLTEGRAAVICFEIDQIDTHGNTFNSSELDTILKELALRFSHELRGANQPETNDFDRYSVAARVDFRRFGVVLPCIDSGSDAESVAERIVESIRQPIAIGSRKAEVAARAGISLFPQDGTDADTLFDNALVAMEDAQNNDEEQIKFHSGTVKLRALQRRDVELEIKAGLDREEFTLHYLPIVDAETEKPQTIEALLRWPQTALGSQSIQNIVSVAERTGLILPIGEWVLNNSCKQLKKWHEAGYTELRIAVNISVQEFSRPDFIERIAATFEECSVDPAAVDLEINEYMLFRDAMRNYPTCNALKKLGVEVVIDDYGTGACSLAHLSRSPVDAIKIDNSFVMHSETVSSDEAACAAITAMAHALNKKVFAEGVETRCQAEMLRDQGCDALQGFLFCQPSAAEGISAWLQQSLRDPETGVDKT